MNIAKTHINHWIEYGVARGISRAELAALFPYVLPTEKDAAGTVTTAELYALLEYIDAQLNDDLIGIYAGNFLTLQLLGLIFQISMETKSIGEALRYLSSYLGVTFPILQIHTTGVDDRTRLQFIIDSGNRRTDRLIMENIMTIICREITLMSTEGVDFRITTPFYCENYPAHWEHGDTFSLSFPQIILKAHMQDRSAQRLDILLPKYLHLMESYQHNASFSGKVKLTMLALSNPHLPDVHDIAQHLFVTPRTLQRRLKDEGQSFRQLKEEIRKQIASTLLLHDNYPVNSLAFILGYADASSFIHSFKNWFGVAPGMMRLDNG